MESLALTGVDHWTWRFTTMLTLSVVVAVMGLSADSAAVVIGAMLIAPLMTPVLATAASLSMSLMRRALLSLGTVALATIWSIVVAYVLSRLIPNGPLPGEVEARTRPDIRDLVVALAAGAAGSYATVRRDVSAALPGVAVAVALVPPLATVGITLEAGETDLALGALLLYVTNLAAIVFAGVMVFIGTGFVPARRLANKAIQLGVAALIALGLVVVVAVPLFGRSSAAVSAAKAEIDARSIVTDWLNGAALDADVDVSGDRVLVSLRGFEPPPDDGLLEETLRQRLGEVNVVVEWVRVERATTTVPPAVSDDEALVQRVEPIVQVWLDDHDGDGYALDRVSAVEGALRIEVSGPGEPPSIDDLLDRLAAELGAQPQVRLLWTPLEEVGSNGPTTPLEVTERRLAEAAVRWAADAAVVVESLEVDDQRVTVDLVGAEAPRIEGLVVALEGEFDGPLEIEVRFTERRLLTTTVLVVESIGGVLPGLAPTTTTTTTAASATGTATTAAASTTTTTTIGSPDG